MDIAKLASGASTIIIGQNSDDEFSDRINYRYTVGLLMFFTLILSTKQYSSEVIKCWVPAHLIIYEDYVAEICWVQNTYYIPPNSTIPKEQIEREKGEIKYYQWVSFVLLLEAFLFYMPRVFWTSFSGKGGLYLSDLVTAARNYKNVDKFYKKGTYMEYLVLNIDQFVDDQRRWENARSKYFIVRLLGTLFPCFGRYLGNYILGLYLITKFFYIFNAILQVSMMSAFLGQSFWSFGYYYVKSLIQGVGWTVPNSKYFPRVTLCDFMIREVGNPAKSHRYTVECVLPVNLFNQQIFTIIWFWYVIVLITNIIGILIWFRRIVPSHSRKWITNRTNLFNNNVNQKLVPNRLNHFLTFYLEPDGIFMIRMIGHNTSDYVATDLIHQLWCQHDEKYGYMFPDEPHKPKNKRCAFPHSRINEYKSHNYMYDEKTYTMARLGLYYRKHKEEQEEYNQERQGDNADIPLPHEIQETPDSSDHEDQYKKVLRKRINRALKFLDKPKKISKNKNGSKDKIDNTRLVDGKVPLPPIINDTTTNSDDSDSFEEQAFNQHFDREKNNKRERDDAENQLLDEYRRIRLNAGE